MTRALTGEGRNWKLCSLCGWTSESRAGHRLAVRRSYGLTSGAQETDGREWQEATHNKERSLRPHPGPPTL